jgi:hypothetical protein
MRLQQQQQDYGPCPDPAEKRGAFGKCH